MITHLDLLRADFLRTFAEPVNLTVLVVGDLISDHYIWGRCTRISPEAPVPVVQKTSATRVLGGAGNVVANLSGLGVTALPLGIIGRDAAGQHVLTGLEQVQAPSDFVYVDPDIPTSEKTRVVAQNQHLLRIDQEEIRPCSSAAIDFFQLRLDRQWSQIDLCIVSDYAKGVCQPELLRRVVEGARTNSVPVLVDPKGADYRPYQGAECIKPNIAEAAQALSLPLRDHDDSVIEGARRLQQDIAAQHVLITRGASGMSLLSGETVTHIPTAAREVYDVSGAGDTVMAVLAAAVGLGLSYERAAYLANVAAGVVIGHVGTAAIRTDELRQALSAVGEPNA